MPTLSAYDFRARTLWPELGRFGEEDPAGSANPFEAFEGQFIALIDPSGEYEEDVHHYLTWFLAEAAGFDFSDSADIGFETGFLDYDERDAMNVSRIHENMARYHFVDALQMRRLQVSATSSPKLNFRAIGEYLHAWEDSYAHQTNKTHRVFGHYYADFPAGHAGHGHEPDQTWRRPELAMQMAYETYEQLRRIRRHYEPTAQARNALNTFVKETPFAQIRDRIEAFVKFTPELYPQRYAYGARIVWNVRDYTEKVKKLDDSFEIAPYERQERAREYQKYLERLRAGHHDRVNTPSAGD